MTDNAKFKSDLETGHAGENMVSEYLISKGRLTEFNTSTDLNELRKWDISITGVTGNTLTGTGYTYNKIEVKRDLKFSKTGNIAIEYKCLHDSTADYWVFILDNQMWYISYTDLFRLASWEYAGVKYVWGGDSNKSYMKIVPFDIFKHFAKQIK